MLTLTPYRREDAREILSWCRDELAFYQWSAGILGAFPITEEAFRCVENLIPITARDERGPAGFFTLRRPPDAPDTLRFGFVILRPDCRGRGLGKTMLQLGVRLALEEMGAQRISLGVFENNRPARRCYLAAGFEDVTADPPETYRILGEAWRCREMALSRK